MANENFSSTVLHEHRRVVTLRHLLALVNFIAIFASTFVTRHFVMIRGTSDGILLIINLILGINAVQILLCIIDYITKVLMGKYSSKIVNISYIVGVIWLVMTVAEFVSGTITLGDVRIDLAVIAGLQLVSAIIAYLIWPHIDYSTIRKMTHKNVRDDASKRSKKATGGALKYVLVCLIMIVVQFALLFAYQLPPKVYDLFSESRQLQYTLSDDGESYEVSGVYQGTSSYVNIPATYNNKPVTKIKSGAISNESVLEKYKIDKIDFGTVQTDPEGNEILVSNVHTIEKGAINNDKITTITLPSSITKIENGAIKSSSLKKVIYEARAQFSYPYLDCTSLTTITFSGTEAGKIISLEGMDPSITLEVPKENYNNYREKNSEYMASIRPILSGDEYVVDFYTDAEYYIESIFAVAGEVVEIKVSDLKNDKYDNLRAPSVDTNAYVANRHETGTDGCRANSAFRGWYYDRNFIEECDFASGSIKVSKDTAIYAKWIDEYTGNMVWGEHKQYRPDGNPDVIHWTEEDLVTLPVINNREGYSGGIVWTVNGQTVRSTQEIFDVYINSNPQATCDKPITVQGSWMFDAPVADITPSVVQEVNYSISTDKNSLSFVYDENQEAILEGVMSHGYADVQFATAWYKEGYDISLSPNNIYRLSDVEESGTYILRVTATSPYGDQSYTDTRIEIKVAKKDLDIGNYELTNEALTYNGDKQTLTSGSVPVDASIGISFEYYDENERLISNNGVKDVGKYKVVVIFAKTNPEEAKNYNTKELSATMEIVPKELTFVSWSSDTFVYDSTEKTVALNFDGKYAGDVVNVIYSEGSNVGKNVGTYAAEAIGVDNKNYTISKMENTSHTWTITPKEVTILRWTLDGAVTNDFTIVYNGEEHRLEAIPEGVFTADKDSVEFIYDQSANTVAATNANKYTAKIVRINSDNYVLSSESVATQEWEITKKTISVSYDAITTFVYNGSQQKIGATLSGIAAKDLDSFTYEKFGYEGMSSGLGISGEKTGDNYVISFSAKDAAAYTAKISGILDSADINLNYVIAENSAAFTITPKTITVSNDNSYTYTGEAQTLSVAVNGIEDEDIASVNYDQFVSDVLKGGKREGESYLLTMTAKNAGDYAFSIEKFNNPNYRFERVDGSIRIEKKNLSITWEITNKADDKKVDMADGCSVEYNAVGYTASAKISGTVMEELVTLAYENNVGLNAGSYVTVASLPVEYTNYSFETAEISWTIAPYVVDFTWRFNGAEHSVSDGAIPEFTYNASVVEISPVYKLLGEDKLDISYASGKADLSATNARTQSYKVAIASIGNSNYKMGENTSFEWRIVPKTVKVTWTNASNTATYNGEYLGPKFKLDGIVENELYVGVSSDTSKFYMTIDSKDGATEYDFKTTKLIINAKEGEYDCAVVGIYTNNGASYVKNENYVVSGASVDYVVNKAPLTLAGWQYDRKGTVSPYTNETALIYCASTYTLTNSINETLFTREGVADDVTLAYTNNSARNASQLKATVYLTGAHKNNYFISGETELNWSINKKEVTASWIENDFVYNGNKQMQSAIYENGALADDDGKVYDGDTLAFDYSYTGNSMDAGNYTSTIIGINNSNYKLKAECVSYEWTIAQKEISYSDFTWSSSSFTYNSSEQYPTASYFDSSVYVTVYGLTYNKAESSKDANVGSDKYVISIASLDNSNYKLVGEVMEHEYVIVPKSVSFTWGFDTSTTNAKNYTYDSVERLVSAYPNSYSGDVINITYNVDSRKIHDAGTYVFSVLAIDNTNYVIDESSANLSKTVVVSPREISLTWGYNTSTSGAGNITYDGSARYLSAHVSNLASGDTEPTLVYSADSRRDVLDVGTYSATVQTADYGNYVISSPISKSVTVSAQTIKISWSGTQSITYDGVSHALVATLTGKINGETVNFTTQYSGANTYTDVGSYTIKVVSYDLDHEAFEASNFALPSGVSKTLTINKQTLKVTWNGTESLTYDGDPHSLTATITGTIDGKTVTFDTYYTGDTTYTNAGSYTVAIASYYYDMDGFSTSNFALPSNTSKTLKINKQNLNVTWNGAETLTYDGNPHSLTATITGSLNGKDVTFNTYYTGATTYTDAGTYTIAISTFDIDKAGFLTSNFSLSGTTTKTLKINKQTLDISWSGARDLVYDGASHTLVATVKGTVAGRTVYASPVYQNGLNAATTVGSYTFKVTDISNPDVVGLNLNNFAFPTDGSISATLKIQQREVKITWNGAENVVYDGEAHSITAIVKGENDKDVAFNYSTNNKTNAGTYTISVSLVDTVNYKLPTTGTSKVLTIAPQSVSIVWSGIGNQVYRTAGYVPTVKVTGVNDNEDVEFSVSGSTATNVGTYNYYLSVTDTNYTLNGCVGIPSAVIQITPQPATVEWSSNTNLVFDGYSHKLTASVTGEDGKSVSVKYSDSTSYSSVGSYTYKITLNNSNYVIEEEDSTRVMTIAPQPVDIQWTSPLSVVYDGYAHRLTAKVTGRNTGANVSFNYSSTDTHTGKGSWNYSITLSDNNYVIDEDSGSVRETLTILPQPVKISWSGNGTYKYTGESHKLIFTVVGMNNGVDLTDYCYGTGTASFKNAGTYTYTITGINNSNYTFEGCDGSLTATATILPMDITIEWVGDTTVTYDGMKHSLEAVVKDEFGNKISIGYKNGNSITEIGTKTVEIVFADLEANYNVVSGSKHQTITVVAPAEPEEEIPEGDEVLGEE